MGHLVSKDVYHRLGKKIDNLTMRTPWNEGLHKIVKELYTEEEADVVVKMPYVLSNLDRISKTTGYVKTRLRNILESLANKGLVIDLYNDGEYYYMPSPLVVGIFEFTMMRTGENLDSKVWAEMFHAYLAGNADFYSANFQNGQEIGIARAVPHRGTVAQEDIVEILDYEKAEAIIAGHGKFAIGICSCRHEKMHNGLKECDVPLETCSSFGYVVNYAVRRNLAREVSREEILENLERSRELGLVLSADTVKRNPIFICSCCNCCCNILQGITKFGYFNTLMTSSCLATVDTDKCTGCRKCEKACPINAIKMIETKPLPEGEKKQKKFYAKVDSFMCLGCGVCALKCEKEALNLKKRKPKVIHPETTFERTLLACLERGTLQNQIFDNPQAITHKVMGGIMGGFLRLPPVKKALMSNTLRSSFLASLTVGAKFLGKGWITKL